MTAEKNVRRVRLPGCETMSCSVDEQKCGGVVERQGVTSSHWRSLFSAGELSSVFSVVKTSRAAVRILSCAPLELRLWIGYYYDPSATSEIVARRREARWEIR